MRAHPKSILLMGAALAMSPGCHRPETPASVINMSDPSRANQLIYGFYDVEMHAWRWTAGKFKVGLKPPADSTHRGARLRLDLFIPDAQIQGLGPMTLTATAAGSPLEPETFSKPGTYVYWRDVRAELLDSNILPVDFHFDRYWPWDVKGRELGAVVSAVALLSK